MYELEEQKSSYEDADPPTVCTTQQIGFEYT